MNLLFLGFILAYNPIFSTFLMANGAIGAITYRVASGTFLLLLMVYRLATEGIYWNRSERDSSLIAPLVATVAIAVLLTMAASIDSRGGWTYVAIDAFPVFELVIVFFYARNILARGATADLTRVVRGLGLYLIFCGITNLASYFLLTAAGVHFGALRAWVNGIVVNRLMDFVLPGCLAALLFGGGALFRSRALNTLLVVLAFLVTALTFFRTVHVTVMLTCICGIALLARKPGEMARALRKCLGMALVAGVLLIAGTGSTKLIDTFRQRIASAFLPESSAENSQSSRFSQLAYSEDIVSNFPFGHGFGAIIKDTPVANMFNYFIQFGIIFGPLLLAVFVLLWVVTLMSLWRLVRGSTQRQIQFVYVGCLLVLTYILLVINLFPYMIQFPVMFVTGLIIAVADRGVEGEKRSTLQGIGGLLATS